MALTKIKSEGIKDGEVKNADMADDAVGVAELSATGTASSSTFLRGDNSWTAVNTDLVSDTSPQLGGNLDAGSHSIIFDDNSKLKLGNDNDLEIYHNGTNSYLANTTGTLFLQSDGGVQIKDTGGNEIHLKTVDNGAVELYHDNSKRLETTSAGVKLLGSGTDAIEMTGDVWFNNNEHAGADIYFNSGDKRLIYEDNVKAVFGGGGDLQIYHDGTTNIIEGLDGIMSIRPKTGENGILLRNNGAVELYHDDTKQCETSADGLAFPSGKGINFNATADASGTGVTAGSELFDDYEEGTWTPTDGSGASISLSTSSTCVYTKIGRMVYLQFDITYASNSSSNDATISGLPFSQSQQYGSGVVGWTSRDNAAGIVLHVDNSNRLNLMDNTGTNSSGAKHLRNDEMSGHRLIGIATYQA